MAASVSGSKTCNTSVAPHLSASVLTSLLATAPENMTLTQFYTLAEALEHVAKGGEHNNSGTKIGDLLT